MLARPASAPAGGMDIAPASFPRAHAGAWLAGVLALAYTAYIVAVGGDYMAMYRFFVPVILMYALVGIAVQQTLLSLQHIPDSAGWCVQWPP